jgi:hypothetical protein
MQKNIMTLYSEIADEFTAPTAPAAKPAKAPKAAKAPPAAKAPKPKKKSIPKVVKDLSWNKWIGEDVARTKCLCCGVNEIKMSSFHCGHVVAEANGGTTTVDNLRPICAACNTSMGTENLNEFKAKCGFGTKTEVVAAPTKPKIEKAPSRIEMLVAKGDLKPCPGREQSYQNMGDLFPRSPCQMASYSKHCDSCGYHFHHIAGYTSCICPCKK